MKRPLLLFLYALVAIIAIAYYINPFNISSWLFPHTYLDVSESEIVKIEGIVTNVSIKEYYSAVYVDIGKESVLVQLSGVDDTSVYDLVGRKVYIQGEVSFPQSRRNPGCFDYSLYLKGRKVFTILTVSKYRIEAGSVKRPLSHFLSEKKGYFYSIASEYMGDEDFSLLAGILFGDKSYMDDELYSSFQSSGISHILAVSGLHVGLLYQVIERLLKNSRSKITSTITLILLYFYCTLSGFSTSVIRASVMIALKIAAVHLGRRYDMLNAATIVAIAFLLYNPYIIFQSGFQMSFLAAYTIACALPYFQIKFDQWTNKIKKEWVYRIGSVLMPGVVLQLSMAPLIAFHFLNISFAGIILNPIALALAGLILPLGLISFILSFAGIMALPAIACAPAGLFIKILILSNSLAEKLSLSKSCVAPPVHLLFIYYFFFFWFFSDTRHILYRTRRKTTIRIVLAASLLVALIMPKSYNISSVTFVDVGQGDCIHINIDGYNILIDGGGNYYKNIGEDTLKPYLLKNGISSIDLAIITHQDQDHSKGIYELSECFEIKEIYEAGTTNDDCGICSICVDGVNFLFMADADTEREADLLASYPDLKCDVIKIGHHGSKTSTGEDFIESVSPSFAVISCGKNNSYGHPSDRVIALLDEYGIGYARTDLYGAISMVSVSDEYIVFQNANKEKTWLIKRNNQIQSTLQRQ